MPKRYWWVIATYVIMQLSGLVAGVFFIAAGFSQIETTAIWTTISFTIALIIILILMRQDIAASRIAEGRATIDESILWAFLGIFIAYGAQIVASIIEQQLLGVQQTSENTQIITEVAKAMPIFIVVVAVFGPILEEVVFRKIIFGSLYKRFDFTIAALVSSLVFGLTHLDPVHLLTYTAIGFVFAFLYYKTKRIIVPIVAHVAMNSIVILLQVIFADEIEKYLEQIEQTAQLIGFVLSISG